MLDAGKFKKKIKQNSHVLDLFPTADLIELWENSTRKDIIQVVGKSARLGAGYAAAVLDIRTIIKLINDLGFSGEVITKTIDSQQYILFKGYAGNRSFFTGTKYLATNPKVLDMSIGRIGINRNILTGARYTIFMIVPLNIVNYFLSDNESMSLLIGKTATDLCKVGIASAVASLAAAATAATTTVAAGPIIVTLAVGVVACLALDALDRKFGVTDSLVREMDKLYDDTIAVFSREMNQVERRLRWQILNGQPVGKGVFY